MSVGIHITFRKFIENIVFDNSLSFSLLGITSTSHLSYTLLTTKDKYLTITNKYLYTENGFTKFMIIDNHHNHYCINNSLWYWKWDSIEDWNKIHINDKLHVKLYGYRIPLFSLFPNIFYTQYQNKNENIIL
jgi:hypothetical protein